jgi:L-ascorbate metabolism protein UlaG (beta-lactamase superfamily)
MTKVFILLTLVLSGSLFGQSTLPAFLPLRVQTNAEASLQILGSTGKNYRVDASTNGWLWQSLVSFAGRATNSHTDSAAPFLPQRFYRATEIATNILTGDHIVTGDGEIVIRPVNHASFVLGWKDRTIYNDPVGASTLYRNFPKADLILVSHSHGDHYEANTLTAVVQTNGMIIVPQAVFNSMSAALKAKSIPLANGGVTNVLGMRIEAVPAYNSNHPKGSGNGYVVTIGGRRFYMSGDTGDAPEIRALQDIDVAFLCMNVPFTMSVPTAAAVTAAMKPKILYPYHYRNQDNTYADLNNLKRLVGRELGVEIRTRAWY